MLLEDGAEPRPASVRFVPRRLEGMPYDPVPDDFKTVDALSLRMESFYAGWVSPLVRSAVTPQAARLLKLSHPMRASRIV